MERRSPQAVLSAAIFFWACISRAICGVTRAFRFALYCGKGKPPWCQAFTQNLHFVTHTANKCTRRQPAAQNISTVNRITKIAMAAPGGQRRLPPRYKDTILAHRALRGLFILPCATYIRTVHCFPIPPLFFLPGLPRVFSFSIFSL